MMKKMIEAQDLDVFLAAIDEARANGADVKVNAKEKRDVMVSQALEQFIKNGQVQEYEMFDNPAFNPG